MPLYHTVPALKRWYVDLNVCKQNNLTSRLIRSSSSNHRFRQSVTAVDFCVEYDHLGLPIWCYQKSDYLTRNHARAGINKIWFSIFVANSLISVSALLIPLYDMYRIRSGEYCWVINLVNVEKAGLFLRFGLLEIVEWKNCGSHLLMGAFSWVSAHLITRNSLKMGYPEKISRICIYSTQQSNISVPLF